MARKGQMTLLQAEDLIAMLEAFPDGGGILGITNLEMAADLRREFGICSLEEEREYHQKNRIGPDGSPLGDC